MRGNSGFLRRLPFSGARSTLARHTVLAMIVLVMVTPTYYAGPVSTRHRRMMREVFAEFDGKSQNETQPEAGTCLLDGLQVPESSVHCEKKSGCRAIQKTGYCCPDYQCECERDGKIYSNGEKLVDPRTPCKVCYCQGGEILCNPVRCYVRNDCEPKYIKGRCCPEYDNCPPLENMKPTKGSTTSETSSPPIPTADPTPSSTTAAAAKLEPPNNNPLGIKIKEITKPEEIRIIDEKPKPYPISKPTDNGFSNQQGKAPSANEQPVAVSSEQPQDAPPASEEVTPATEGKFSKGATTETANKLETDDVNTINDEDSMKTVRHTSSLKNKENEVTDSPKEALIGDKGQEGNAQVGSEVVILDRNGNTQPITVFGIEGLERVDDVKSSPDPSNAASDKPVPDLESAASNNDDYVKVLPASVVKHENAEMTTEGLPLSGSSSPAGIDFEVYDTALYTSGPEGDINDTSIAYETILHDAVESREQVNVSSTERPGNVATHHMHPEYYETTSNEPNPNYPTIVDEDLSISGREVTAQLEGEDIPEGHRSKSSIQKTDPVKTATNTNSDGARASKLELTTEGLDDFNLTDTSKESIESRAPGEPFLIPEWERNNTDTLNQTDDSQDIWRKRNNKTENDTTEGLDFWPSQGVGIELDLGSGSGLEAIPPCVYTGVDIDEPEASADSEVRIKHDPKEDAESVKYEEGSNPEEDKTMLQKGLSRAINALDSFQKSTFIFGY